MLYLGLILCSVNSNSKAKTRKKKTAEEQEEPTQQVDQIGPTSGSRFVYVSGFPIVKTLHFQEVNFLFSFYNDMVIKSLGLWFGSSLRFIVWFCLIFDHKPWKFVAYPYLTCSVYFV